MNEYGLNYKYFEGVIKREFGHGLDNYRPDELARVCLRIARTASPETFREREFINKEHENKIKAEALREAKNKISSGATEDTHKHMIIEGRYCYISTRSIDEYANKLEKGE